MDDSQPRPPPVVAGPSSSSGLLLTATIAVVGSAMLLWRVHRHNNPKVPAISVADDIKDDESSSSALKAMDDKRNINNRSKERRKRGKDPYKDLLKNGRKLDRVLAASTGSAPVSPTLPEPERREPSLTISERDIILVDAETQTTPTAEVPVQLPVPPVEPPRDVSASPSVSVPSDDANGELVSLRSALDALHSSENTLKRDLESRNRELDYATRETTKSARELDRVSKELESTRWENTSWKRQQNELQTQLQWMSHQLHGYAAMFAHQQQQQFFPPPPLQPPASSSSANGSPASLPSSLPSSSAPSQPQSPTNLTAPVYHPMMFPPPPNGIAPPPILSPTMVPMPMSPMSPVSPQGPSVQNGGQYFSYPAYPAPYLSPPVPQPFSITPFEPTQGSSSSSSVQSSRSRGRKREKKGGHHGPSEEQQQQLSLPNGVISTHAAAPQPPPLLPIHDFGQHMGASPSRSNPPSSSSSSSASCEEYEHLEEEFNSVLADAILKRPERLTGSVSASSSSSGGGRAAVSDVFATGGADDDTAASAALSDGDGPEEPAELEQQPITWPSIYPNPPPNVVGKTASPPMGLLGLSSEEQQVLEDDGTPKPYDE